MVTRLVLNFYQNGGILVRKTRETAIDFRMVRILTRRHEFEPKKCVFSQYRGTKFSHRRKLRNVPKETTTKGQRFARSGNNDSFQERLTLHI